MSKEAPRKKTFASNPGYYGLVIRVSRPIVDPGEKLEVEVYFSGYGNIGPAKVAFYPSSEVFDLEKSSVRSDIKKLNEKLYFGGQERKLDAVGHVVTLRGFFEAGWERPTYFIDLHEEEKESFQILTETSQCLEKGKAEAPIHLDLTIQKNARPGPQSVQFLFTYFNGETWASSSGIAQFTIRNLYQQNEIIIMFVGLTAAIVTILLGIKVLLCPTLLTILRKIFNIQ